MPTVVPRRLVAAAASAVMAVSGLLFAAAPAQAAPCSDIDVVFARGTGEAPGLGVTGRPFLETLTGELSDRTVSSYAVDYAANSSQSSAAPGATDMSSHISSVAAACPSTRFVIGGYSQGATVTSKAVGIRTGSGTGTPIPAALADRVLAVVVFGNPLGLSRQTIASASPTYGPKSKDYCNASDNVCNYGNTGSGGHLSYVSNGSVAAGARFAAALVRQAPTAPGTPGTPTPVSCVRASTTAHVGADRAVSLYGRAYARGSRDSLGATSRTNIVSLRQITDGWQLVSSC